MFSVIKRRFATTEKGFIRKASKTFPLTLIDCVDSDSVINLTIEGNCSQATTPAFLTPIEIQGVGDKTTADEYKITVVTTDGSTGGATVSTEILLAEPLRYTDVLNTGKKDITRKFGYIELDATWRGKISTYEWTSSTGVRYCGFSFPPIIAMSKGTRQKGFCSHAQCTRTLADKVWFGANNDRIFFLNEELFNSGIDGFCAWLDEQKAKGTPLSFAYPLAEPITEKATVPKIPTYKGKTVLSINNAVKPLSGSAEYFSTTKE